MITREIADSCSGYQSARYQVGRRYNRFDLQFPVRLSFRIKNGLRELETISKNVSTCSVLVKANDSVPLHTPVRLTMMVQSLEPLRPVLLSGEGEVVRVERLQRGSGFALAVACEHPITEMENDLPATS